MYKPALSPARAKLKSALEKIEPAGESAAHISAAGFYDAISANAGQWGGNWSRVLLIGDFPALETATKDYAEALLLRAFSSQHVQVSWFSPAGGDEAWAPVFGASGGAVVHGDLGEFARTLTEAAQFYFQVDWTCGGAAEWICSFENGDSGWVRTCTARGAGDCCS